jgi:hypothetical protein
MQCFTPVRPPPRSVEAEANINQARSRTRIRKAIMEAMVVVGLDFSHAILISYV